MNLDLEKCRRGMRQLNIEGSPRDGLIEEAIVAIQRDPTDALQARYFGIKNYASFGDQREDHEYGYGPKHGTIVFRIERQSVMRGASASGSRKPLDGDAVYYLEAYRDFGTIPWEHDRDQSGCQRVTQMNLGQAIRAFDRYNKLVSELQAAFTAVCVDAHVVAAS
jgi:hypothetical protein